MLRAGVDFDNNGWVCLHAERGDAPNLFGTNAPYLYDTVGFYVPFRVLAGAFTVNQYYIGSVDEDYYGRLGASLTSFGSGDILVVGSTAGPIKHNLEHMPAGDYSASLWIKNRSGVETATVRFSLWSYTDDAGISSSAVTVDDDWQRLTVSGNLPYSDMRLELRLGGVSGSFLNDLIVTGPMVVAGTRLPDWLNAGADSFAENITAYVRSARWTTGFVQPFQNLAPVGRATLHLNNQDKRFSPENTTGPLYGKFGRDRVVRIKDDDTTLWTGYVSGWNPQFGAHTARYATLIAVDGRIFYDNPEVSLKVQVNKSPEQIIRHIIARVQKISQYRMMVWLHGDPSTPGVWEVDWGALETQTTPYYLDNAADGTTASYHLADLLVGIQGKAWHTRYGFLTWAGPNAASASPVTFLDTAKSIDYAWGEPIVNDCTVMYYQRNVSAATNVKLWSLDTTFDVASGETETMRCYFKDNEAKDARVSAITGTVAIAVFTASGGRITATITDVDSTSCTIDVVNSSGGTRTVTAMRIEGQMLTAFNAESRTREDSTSIDDNGRRTERIDSKWTPSRKWAKQLAQFRVNRFKDPAGAVRSIVGRYQEDPARFALCEVGRVVRVSDSQLAHDKEYVVIGEDHDWRPGVNNHEVRLYLEPRTPTRVSTTSL